MLLLLALQFMSPTYLKKIKLQLAILKKCLTTPRFKQPM
jgi:hypothetical protein